MVKPSILNITKFKELLTIMITIFIYGLLLVFIFNSFLKIEITLQTILAYGLVWYFLKYEIPVVFRKYFGGNQ